MISKNWFIAAGIRAVKTMAQTAVSLIGVAQVPTLESINWITIASASVVAGVLSMLTSLAGLPELEDAEEK